MLQKLPDLLQPDRAPAEVAAVMSKADDPYAAMKAAGFPAPHVPGLPQYVHLAFVKQIAPQLDQASAQDRLLRWLKPDQAPALQVGHADVNLLHAAGNTVTQSVGKGAAGHRFVKLFA